MAGSTATTTPPVAPPVDASAYVLPDGSRPWLVNLNAPDKLTPEQRRECGVDTWTCRSGSKRSKKACRKKSAADVAVRKERCAQWAAVPPPPSFSTETPSTNPASSVGADEAGQQAQFAAYQRAMAELSGQNGSPYEGGDAYGYVPLGDGQLLVPHGRTGRAASDSPYDDEGGGMPWLLIAGAAALGWWLLR